jgi:large subunit ribosomal protein L15
MRLNTLQPGVGAKQSRKRLGRGIGSGLGKTCGRGHKGQRARAGGFHKLGFEGGQMPKQRRLPKFGFNSAKALVTAEVRLHELTKVGVDVIDLQALRDANIISSAIQYAKVIASGSITKPIRLRLTGIKVTKGARAAIEAAGGSVIEG